MTKIAILGHQEVTALVIENLMDFDIHLHTIIGLTPEKGLGISEYVDLKILATEADITHSCIVDYSLETPDSHNIFIKESFDIVIVVGWSRLIPHTLLSLVDTQFIGWHGGPFLPPRCRGRAVVNWAIINNETDFFVYTMLIDEGVDSGRIVDTSFVSIQLDETAQSLYIKCAIEIAKLFKNFISGNGEVVGITQVSDGATYLPKRYAEDGEIDWLLPANVIARLVRALSKPFPSAWTQMHGNKLYVKRASVLDINLDQRYKIGQIVNILRSSELIIQTSKGLLLIEDYEFHSTYDLKRLDLLSNSNMVRNVTKMY